MFHNGSKQLVLIPRCSYFSGAKISASFVHTNLSSLSFCLGFIYLEHFWLASEMFTEVDRELREKDKGRRRRFGVLVHSA